MNILARVAVVVVLGFGFAGVAEATTLYSQSMTLASGWNIVSTPRVLDSHTFSATENSTNFDIYVLNPSNTAGWTTMADLGQTEFTPLYGYFINNKTGTSQVLTLNYEASTTPNERLFSRSFSQTGWYSVGVANPTYGLPQGTSSVDTNNVASILFSLGTNYSQVIDFTTDTYSSNPDSVTLGGTWDARTQSDANALHDLRETKAYAIYITNTAGLYTGFQDDSIPVPAECGDGVDNDGDGLIDFSNDPGCTSTNDSSEDSLPGTVSVVKASTSPSSNVTTGASNVKWATFEFTASNKEDVKIESLNVIASTTLDHGLDNGKIFVDGVQVGSTKDLTDATAVNFTFGSGFILQAGETAVLDIYADAKTTTGAAFASGDAVAITLGTGASNASGQESLVTINVPGSDIAANTLTITSPTLTESTGTSPDNANVIAGSNDVKVGSFNFTASNSTFTVQELMVKIPANAATSVSSVTLKWAANTTGVSQALTLSSGAETHATATFTGLTFSVPTNETKTIDVYVNIPTVANGATSGTAITALLDWDNGFKAVDSAGTASTTMSSFADLNSATTTGKGTMYVRKSKPTIAAVALDSTTLTNGTDQVLGRFSVTADAAGKIDWGFVVFTVNKTSAITIGSTSTLAVWSGSNQIVGSIATTTGSLIGGLDACANQTTCLLHFRPTTVETIEAGNSKTYELRGTIGGLAGGANNVSVSIANPQTTASSTATFEAAAGTQGVSTAASFAWSDWSDLSDHSSSATGASTADWTGDYLVKALPLTVGNRSLSF